MAFSGTFPSALLQVDRLPSRTPYPGIVTKVPLPILYLRNLDNPRHGPTLE
jgi:hypothetical protein